MVLVSVVIPVFNGEKTIVETLESVISQTLQDIEIIVVNDGSTDRTLEVLSQIQDSRVKVLTYLNSGVAESRNRGIKQAQGEFLAFLDADDLWTKDKLEEQVSALKNNSKATVAYSWNDFIDESGRLLHHGWHPNLSGDVYADLVRYCFIENGSNILVRRVVAKEIGGFDSSVEPAEDWDFYLRLADKHEFTCVPQVHVLYRILEETQSQNMLKMEQSGLKVLKRALLRQPQRSRHVQSEGLANFYGYLFHKAFQKKHTRENCWTAVMLFTRGCISSPMLWKKVAKKRVIAAAKVVLLG